MKASFSNFSKFAHFGDFADPIWCVTPNLLMLVFTMPIS